MRASVLWIKRAPEHRTRRARAAAYKRAFGGICGALTWKELARESGAGRPRSGGLRGVDVGSAPKQSIPRRPVRASLLGMLCKVVNNLTRRAAR
jgi:hypothetical protein